MPPIRLGLAGYGKIAQDQHLPAIAGNPAFELVAIATHGQGHPELPTFGSLAELLETGPAVDAIAFCTPPQGRYGLVQQAVAAGKHVLVEKPPCASLGEAMALAASAERSGLAGLFAWHSRFAPGVALARDWLAGMRLEQVHIQWKEQVRKWHPGQDWIWQPGGLGVFDPGINALSIVTALLPAPMLLEHAERVVPADRQAPISATLRLRAGNVAVAAEFDFDHQGDDELWSIELRCVEGTLRLDNGGAVAQVDGVRQRLADEGEYTLVYRHFARLIEQRQRDMDVEPLRIVADAFLAGQARQGPEFAW
ncbi:MULTISPECIES: Gfo/Idh/MocA family protein [unclassified Pseudomonas]|uniref:Gfo/Idh/MocA family protein n=1 Tax=unclassified Pseudomonas TaxID=196821 RepID=UPI000BDD2AA7|nr:MULTISPECIES: Gfo/Idh/MocA family oxidoreductase [unclassified Pseudomonas]PVZ16489.1 putative dehydrogenase [Pseudomonas sp. URIL14HWK12:I12]PVZ25655.1 putative dehydrogenase [Pseudomonas sp. URIL14HWK12:I10]PVZ36821.1 putative dehydrogenase [Pseudomonas sp. URIL14HWK12:I11]SNZ12546.1 Oxidoreductase family, NAD-binding Rossmann fold [Pseudomonas sp. URIL14HWK12:I9]